MSFAFISYIWYVFVPVSCWHNLELDRSWHLHLWSDLFLDCLFDASSRQEHLKII